MTVPSTIAQAGTAARLGVAATLLGLDRQSLIEHALSTIGEFTRATAFTDANVRTIGFGMDLRSDDELAHRLGKLRETISRSQALARAAIARPGMLTLEVGEGMGGLTAEGMAGTFVTLSSYTTTSLESDISVATTIGLVPEIAQSLGKRLSDITHGGERRPRVLRTTIYAGEAGHDTRVELASVAPNDVVARLRRMQRELAISDAQLSLLDKVHDILAASTEPVWIRCAAERDAVLPGCSIVYSKVSLDTAMRVVNGLSTDVSAMSRWGTFVGALGATQVQELVMPLGPEDPIPARLTVSIDDGVPTA